MKPVRRFFSASTLAISAVFPAGAAHAQSVAPPPAVTITVDEDGHGTATVADRTVPLPEGTTRDPGPGGMVGVLTYILGDVRVVPGDVRLSELVGTALVVSDIARFESNPDTTATDTGARMFFYSDTADGMDALADVGLPGASAPNAVTIPEVGIEGGNGAIYKPGVNDPGYVTGFDVTYHFISDAVPEPTTWGLMLLGFGALGIAIRRKKFGMAQLA